MTQVNDILIKKDGKWVSFRGVKIYIAGVWREFHAGCGVYHNGQWHTLKDLSTAIDVYITTMVTENKDGEMTWHLNVSSSPDVIISAQSEITIDGSIFMNDTSVYNISLTATSETQTLDTRIPYIEDTAPSHLNLGISFSSPNYHLGELYIL